MKGDKGFELPVFNSKHTIITSVTVCGLGELVDPYIDVDGTRIGLVRKSRNIYQTEFPIVMHLLPNRSVTLKYDTVTDVATVRVSGMVLSNKGIMVNEMFTSLDFEGVDFLARYANESLVVERWDAGR